MDKQDKNLESLKQYYEEGKNPLAYIPYSEALRRKNDLGKALEICTNGLKQDSYSVTGRTVLAKIFYDMGRYEDAMHQIRVALQISPEAFGPNVMLAKIFLKQRHFNESQEIINRIQTLKPNDTDVKYINEELKKYVAKADTKVHIPEEEEAAFIDTVDESGEAEIRIVRVKDILKTHDEIIAFDVYKIDPKECMDEDTSVIHPITLFYTRCRKDLFEKNIGKLSKGFFDLNCKQILFYRLHIFLLVITFKANPKFGKLKKEIEDVLYG